MPDGFLPQLRTAFLEWWRERSNQLGVWNASTLLARELWDFIRDFAPERRRSRYGDVDYDWEYRVNTSSGPLTWRERLLGTFLSAYQPTDPTAFLEMMSALPIDFRDFTFIDLGSGKGRTLLMAARFPFHEIKGVEVIPSLHAAAEANLAAYLSRSEDEDGSPPRSRMKSICQDARSFVFPATQLVIYLFNPLPEAGLRSVLENLELSWKRSPRPIWIVYHNPLLEPLLARSDFLKRIVASPQFSIYRTST